MLTPCQSDGLQQVCQILASLPFSDKSDLLFPWSHSPVLQSLLVCGRQATNQISAGQGKILSANVALVVRLVFLMIQMVCLHQCERHHAIIQDYSSLV